MYELHNAARNGHLGAIAATIGADADLNEKYQHSRTPLLMACWSGQTASTICSLHAIHEWSLAFSLLTAMHTYQSTDNPESLSS